VVGPCEYSNKPSGFTEGREFLELISASKEQFSSMELVIILSSICPELTRFCCTNPVACTFVIYKILLDKCTGNVYVIDLYSIVT
jgi:hypothetical protein